MWGGFLRLGQWRGVTWLICLFDWRCQLLLFGSLLMIYCWFRKLVGLDLISKEESIASLLFLSDNIELRLAFILRNILVLII
jgi:hypothetical protein